MKSSLFKNISIDSSRTILIVLLMLCIIVQSCVSYERSEESEVYLNDPKVGDLYFIKLDDQVFTLYKVKQIESDHIVFNTNKGKCKPERFMDESEGYIKYIRTGELDMPRLWSDSLTTMTISSIKKSFKDETIFEIKRY